MRSRLRTTGPCLGTSAYNAVSRTPTAEDWNGDSMVARNCFTGSDSASDSPKKPVRERTCNPARVTFTWISWKSLRRFLRCSVPSGGWYQQVVALLVLHHAFEPPVQVVAVLVREAAGLVREVTEILLLHVELNVSSAANPDMGQSVEGLVRLLPVHSVQVHSVRCIQLRRLEPGGVHGVDHGAGTVGPVDQLAEGALHVVILGRRE